jgi:diadenosine tetraphosphate (Ap4A) HIT family hydrolase
LCEAVVEPLWDDGFCRVVAVDDRDYPGFCRVILDRHVSEMSDLPDAERIRLMRVVFALESVLRAATGADKINLASFGNQVPHLHWHVIPRWRDDRHFPDPLWAPAQRATSPRRPLPDPGRLRSELLAALGDDRRQVRA